MFKGIHFNVMEETGLFFRGGLTIVVYTYSYRDSHLLSQSLTVARLTAKSMGL